MLLRGRGGLRRNVVLLPSSKTSFPEGYNGEKHLIYSGHLHSHLSFL